MTVFVSYKGDDRGAVEEIVRGLKAEGLEVWWDQGIAPTAEWRAEVQRQLQAAKAVVVVWSRNTVDLEKGKFVIQEAEEADGRGLLVPVMIDEVLPPLGLRHKQAADLIQWHGDRQDPRWRGFMETVRATLEGRAVNAQLARETGPATAGAMLRGRGALLWLALGLAALVVTSAIAFGPVTAAAIAGGLALAYITLNLLFGRRKNEQAAATFLRRVFAVGWVTALANIIVWTGAIGAGAWPYARGFVFADFTVAVYDELRKPVPDAQVSVTLDGKTTPVALDKDGIGRVAYPLKWGPREGLVALTYKGFETERAIAREGERFANLVLGAPSGVERFRVRHITLDELAIDAIHKGQTPQDLKSVLPPIAGVVRNAAWEEAERYLAIYETVGSLGGSFYGAQTGASAEAFDAMLDQQSRYLSDPVAQARARGLRWPRAMTASATLDFSKGIEGCPLEQPLDASYTLTLGNPEGFYLADRLSADGGSGAALDKLGAAKVRDSEGVMPGRLSRTVDHTWISALLASKPEIVAELGSDAEVFRYLAYMAERGAPAGLVDATYRLTVADGCGNLFTAVSLQMPAAKLRVSVVENVSDAPLPIAGFVEGVKSRKAMEVWAQAKPDASALTPWAGGALAPGQAIIVPRRLILENGPPSDLAARLKGLATGAQVRFNVLARTEVQPLDLDETRATAFARNARGFTILAGQIEIDDEPPHSSDETPLAPAPAGPSVASAEAWVIGASVETLSVRINDVDFDQREDKGVALAMIGGFEVGSCPFVFAAEAGGGRMRNMGPILSDQIGRNAEAWDRVYLGRSVGAIEVRELEPEISHLNAVRLVVRDKDGRERRYAPAQSAMRAKDAAYHTLKEGERVALSFPGYRPEADDRAVFLEAAGYYQPLPAPYKKRVALYQRGILE